MTLRASTATASDPPLHLLLTVGVLSLALMLGGGQGSLGDSLTQTAALLLIGALLYRQPDIRQWPLAACLAVLPVLAIALYLLPWPHALNQAGEMRSRIADMLQPMLGYGAHAGALIPQSAERALFWLLPGIAVFWAGVHSSLRQKALLASVVLAWVFIGALFGLAQKAGGTDSLLYFFSNTNRGMAVGFFANNNHYAVAMAASLPLVWAGLVWLFNRRMEKNVHPLWFPAVSSIAIVFILGFMLSGSRAGLILGMFGCLLMLPAVIDADRHEGAKHWLFATLAIGLFLTAQIGLYFVALQFEASMLDDTRFPIADITRQASAAFAPSGTGPGGFWFAFPQFDHFLTGSLIVNHAHNDYLELWLELRWLALFAGLPLLALYVWQGLRIWLRGKLWDPDALLLARSAWVGLLLLLIHSFVDYPLRTTAISAMAGLFAALIHLPASARVPD